MSDITKPRAYVAQRFTQQDVASEERDQEFSVEIAKSLSDAGYLAHLAWANEYHLLKSSHVPSSMYRMERDLLTESELLVVLDTGPSTGIGRDIEIAEQHLVEVIHVRLTGVPESRMASGHVHFVHQEIRVHSASEIGIKLPPLLNDLFPLLQSRRARWPKRNIPPLCAARIRRLREELGLSRESLAELAGISRKYVVEIEEGTTVPSLYTLRVLAAALGYETPAPLLAPHAEKAAKLAERQFVFDFFVKHKLRMHRYLPFCETYENSPTALESPTTEEDLWTIYLELFGPPD